MSSMADSWPTSSVIAYSGSSYEIILLDQSKIFARSSCGMPMSSAMAWRGSSQATWVTKSKESPGSVRAVAQALLQGADGPGREDPLDDPADPGVLRRVHVQQDQALGVDRVPLDVLVEADDRRVEVRREDLGVGGDVLDVRVPGDRPVPPVLEAGDVARLGDPAHRFGPAQFGELRQRYTALQQVGVGEVEPVGKRWTLHRQLTPAVRQLSDGPSGTELP